MDYMDINMYTRIIYIRLYKNDRVYIVYIYKMTVYIDIYDVT